MLNDFWIKLPVRYLEDVDFMMLPSEVKWTFIEIYLLAKRANSGGMLRSDGRDYSVDDMAYLLHENSKSFEKRVGQLIDANFLRKEFDCYEISNYEEDQGVGSGTSQKSELIKKSDPVVIEDAKRILEKMDIYIRSCEATDHWESLKAQKTHICELCGKDCATHYHHIDTTLRPKSLFGGFKYMRFWAKDSAIPLGPEEVLKYYLSYYGIENIEKSTKYFSVSRNELIELCPSCHKRMHTKDGISLDK
jgi:hypothetical protein